jgi:hypothetical protein
MLTKCQHNCPPCLQVAAQPERQEAALLQVLSGLGMTPSSPAVTPPPPSTHLTVMLDGKVVGSVANSLAGRLVDRWVMGGSQSKATMHLSVLYEQSDYFSDCMHALP